MATTPSSQLRGTSTWAATPRTTGRTTTQVRCWAVEQLAASVTWQGWVPEVPLLARRRCGLVLGQLHAQQLASGGWMFCLDPLQPHCLLCRSTLQLTPRTSQAPRSRCGHRLTLPLVDLLPRLAHQVGDMLRPVSKTLLSLFLPAHSHTLGIVALLECRKTGCWAAPPARGASTSTPSTPSTACGEQLGCHKVRQAAPACSGHRAVAVDAVDGALCNCRLSQRSTLRPHPLQAARGGGGREAVVQGRH